MIKQKFLDQFKAFQNLGEEITEPEKIKAFLIDAGMDPEDYKDTEKVLSYNGAFIHYSKRRFYCEASIDSIKTEFREAAEQFLFTEHYAPEILSINEYTGTKWHRLDTLGMVEKAINGVFWTMHEQSETTSGDITPEQQLKLDDLQNQIAELITKVVNQNI